VLANAISSGTTTQEEAYDFADRSARYVRYLGHGNTANLFNSLTEVSIFALPATSYVEVTPTGAAVTASTNDGNVPGNAVDNNLTTRWSANGDGQWLQLDLGTARTIGHVKVAAYNGNTRSNIFELQISAGGGVWTTVWSGQSSGTTTAEEMYDFTDVSARWVRYLGHMNTANGFNSVTEISIFATP
jgi:poly(beta-D-mannuronate) lyase